MAFPMLDSNGSFDGVVSAMSNLTTASNRQENSDPWILSEKIIQYVYTINLAIVCAALCLLAIATNVINIVVFARMGYKETINIAFTALAISDVCSMISLLWLCICYNPLFMFSHLPILTVELQYKTGGWTHVIFTRVASFLTVYITLERCLCVAYPLTIRTVLTPRRVLTIIVCIYVVIIGSLIPNYTNFRFAWKFVPDLNRTMYGMIYTDNRVAIQTPQYYLNIFYIMVSFTAVIVCSSILIWKLAQRTKFLRGAAAGQADMTTREVRGGRNHMHVVKMVVSVGLVFIVTFTPSVVVFLALAIDEDFNYEGKYGHLAMAITTICLTFNAVNASANIFIYYNMGSKYAFVFRALFSPNLKNYVITYLNK